MSDDYIRREDAIRLAEQGQVQGFPWQFQKLLRLPSADVVPTEPQEIGYDQCANAMLKMWMDNVVTDGEYNRIMDRLNKLYFGCGERKE